MKKTFVTKAQIEAIAEKFPTPFHLYDEKGMRENARDIQEAFAWNPGYREYFAVKANSNPFLLKILKEHGFGADCSSMAELLIANELGFKGEEIMFSSNETRPEEYKMASEMNAIINLDDITHIFFHTLIVDNNRCFDDDHTAGGYNQYMTTCDEFWAMMEEMYARGFVLVSPYDVAYEVTDEYGSHFQYGDIRLPEGKKPFLMSQDDVNYYGYMIGTGSGVNETPVFASIDGDGFASRIVIGEDGYPTCEYMDKDGNVTTGDFDLVPVLETFIRNHPDFSYRGARAILGMTGYEGVFGYRTKPAYEDDLGTEAFQKECEDAKAVAQCLRDHGWILASHSYGHPSYGNISAEKVASDSDKWEQTVQPIIGDCDIILYPNGSDIAGIGKYTFDNAKFAALYEDGYRYFYNVDSHVAWQQLGEDYFRGGRRNLDGYRMWHTPKKVADLFDVSEVFDPDRPTPVPSI